MELLGIIIAALSLLATAITYIADKLLVRKQRTIEKLSELRNNYHESIAGKEKRKDNDYYRNCVKLFSDIELFCTGVLSGYYAYGIVKKNGSKFISTLFYDYKEYLIDQRRKQFSDECYKNLETLVGKLNNKRSKPSNKS